MTRKRRGMPPSPVAEADVTDQELTIAHELRSQWRKSCFRDLAVAGQDYLSELARDDAAHAARLSQRLHHFRALIDEAHAAMHRGPVTRAEIDEAKAWGEWERLAREIGVPASTPPHLVDRPYTIRQLASHWRCSEGTIRNMIARGELRAARIGRLVRIPVAEVRRKEQEKQP